jgi:hypothetical protein
MASLAEMDEAERRLIHLQRFTQINLVWLIGCVSIFLRGPRLALSWRWIRAAELVRNLFGKGGRHGKNRR